MKIIENPTKQIDTYIQNLPDFSKKICTRLREIIHKAIPDVVEQVKWGSPSFMYKNRLVCFIWAFTKHASIVYYEGALIKDTYHIFNDGENNLKSRTIKFTDVSEINEKKLTDYLHKAIQNIEDGKSVKIPVSKDKTVIIPDYIKTILKKEKLLEKYESMIYTYRKGYVQWIEQAKQEETKQRRIYQMVEELREGNVYMGMSI